MYCCKPKVEFDIRQTCLCDYVVSYHVRCDIWFELHSYLADSDSSYNTNLVFNHMYTCIFMIQNLLCTGRTSITLRSAMLET